MPLYMLDTNMCIYLMRHQPEQVARRFGRCYAGDVVMSAVTYAELQYGVTVAQNSALEGRHLAALIEDIWVVPFDAAAALCYGPVRYATRERKRDQLDKLIASHAVALGVTLVTNNEHDFVAYPGLCIENWLNDQ